MILFRKLMTALVLTISVCVFSSVAKANEGMGTQSINNIDVGKKIITVGDQKFKYTSATVVYDLKGNTVSIDVLRVGLAALVNYDTAERYISYRTLKSIKLQSALDD